MRKHANITPALMEEACCFRESLRWLLSELPNYLTNSFKYIVVIHNSLIGKKYTYLLEPVDTWNNIYMSENTAKVAEADP